MITDLALDLDLKGTVQNLGHSRVKKVKKVKKIFFFFFFFLYAIKYQKKCIKKNSALFNPFSGGFFMGGVRIKKIIKLFLCSKYCRIFLKFM